MIWHLGFVLDGIRSLFRLVVLKCAFIFNSNIICKSEQLVVLFWCRQDQKGPGGADIYTITIAERGTYVHLDRCAADVWY